MPAGRAAVVVGATGFLGGALVSRLAQLGVTTESFTRARPFVDSRGALRGEWDAVGTAYWLAGSIRPATADAHSREQMADLDALRTLLDAVRRDAPHVRIVAASSGGTIYDASRPAPYDEASPVRPANAYGAAMQDMEQLVSSASASTVVRVSNAYGPGQLARRGQGVVAHWLSAIAEGRQIQLIGSDDLARDYVYIDDVADALARVHLCSGPVPPVVNIGSGIPTTLGDLLNLVEQIVAPAPVAVRREPGRTFDAASTWLDISRASSALGWLPTVSLREGLTRTWAWLGDRSGRPLAQPGGRP